MSKRKKSVPRVRLDVGPQLRVPKLQYTDRWYETIKNIPVPYGGKSPHKATLLAIISKSDLNRMDESTLNQLTKRADDTVKFYLNKYSKELARQPDKKERAEELLERARFYLAEARKLERSWRNGFYATGFGDTQPWPLHISWSKLHNGHCKLKGYGYKGKNVFDPSCPTKKEHEGHDADVAVLERLLLAAAKCIAGSREIATLTHIYEVNKVEARTHSGGPKTRSGSGTPGTTSPGARAKATLDPVVPTITAKTATFPTITAKAATFPRAGITSATGPSLTAGVGEGASSTAVPLDEEEPLEDELLEEETVDDAMVEDELGAEEPDELADDSEEPDELADESEEPDELADESGEPSGEEQEAPAKKAGASTGLLIAGVAVVGGLLLFGKK